jgi:hypothetical protein
LCSHRLRRASTQLLRHLCQITEKAEIMKQLAV